MQKTSQDAGVKPRLELTLGQELAYGASLGRLWTDAELERVHKDLSDYFEQAKR